MRAWVDLYAAHRATRALRTKAWDGDVRKCLVRLAKAGHCNRDVEGRFTYATSPDNLVRWSIRDAPLALVNLPGLSRAELSVLALVSRRRDHLHQLTVTVEGARPDGSTWALAVHLPDDREFEKSPGGDRQGLGACSHAALHCHVGPGLDAAPKVRVPLPALGPVDIVDWVLSQVLPTAAFEPAPWPEVEQALKDER